MNRTVERGKTLLVDGPASITVHSGKVGVLGSWVRKECRIVVREGKRLPFFAGETANLNISLGESANVEEVQGDTVPPSWAEAFELLTQFQKKPVVALVIGKTDSGKTSLCAYLANRLFGAKQRVAVLDGDLGQSEIGPPCTVACAFVSEPLTEMHDLDLRNAFFVGSTSPNGVLDKTVEGMVSMRSEINEQADFVIINTDGWVEGEEASKYKTQLAEKLDPDVVLCVQQKDELKPLLNALKKFVTTIVESPQAVRPRDAAKRRNLRELNYAKYFVGAKLKSLPLSCLKIEEDDAMCNRLHEAKGLLLGLYDFHRRFLGIGILTKVDLARKTLMVFTSVSKMTAIIKLGKVTLDKDLRETTNSSLVNNCSD